MKSLLLLLFYFPSLFAFANTGETILKRSIELELEEVADAKLYEIELKSKASGKVLTFKMKRPVWKASIRPAEYLLRLRSYDRRGVPGAWSTEVPFSVKLLGPSLLTPKNGEQIKAEAEENAKVNFNWRAAPGADKYRLDIKANNSNWVSYESTSPNLSLELPVANTYEWKVTGLTKDNEETETQEKFFNFTLLGKKLERPKIDRPYDLWVDKLNWSSTNYADHYKIRLERRAKNKNWETVLANDNYKSTQLEFLNSYAGGLYRLSVSAHANLRPQSVTSRREFKVASGDRSPAAVEEARLMYSMEKPTKWYMLFSWLGSTISYKGVDADLDKYNFDSAPTGTGRVGVGYINPRHNVGYLFVTDLSGLVIEGKNTYYKSLEAHYIARRYWRRNMVRPSAGLFYKELVNAKKNPTDNTVDIDTVSHIGPHVGVDVWRPLTNKYGVQFNSRIYYGYFGINDPDSSKATGTLSYQMGVMGSMKLRQNIMGLAGWAYRRDYQEYDTSSAEGTKSILMQGHYLNLYMEYSF